MSTILHTQQLYDYAGVGKIIELFTKNWPYGLLASYQRLSWGGREGEESLVLA